MNEPHPGLQAVFGKAPFIADLGVRLVAAGEGWLDTELDVSERLRQQHGFAHAGVVATLADHTAGGAASTIVPEGRSVLTSQYTIHLLRPAEEDRLRCRGEVVKRGRLLIVAQADVWAGEQHCARYLGTMAVVERAL
ncbi:MAG: PaaI family thioesterase [Acidimicrobiia bacterium]